MKKLMALAVLGLFLVTMGGNPKKAPYIFDEAIRGVIQPI